MLTAEAHEIAKKLGLHLAYGPRYPEAPRRPGKIPDLQSRARQVVTSWSLDAVPPQVNVHRLRHYRLNRVRQEMAKLNCGACVLVDPVNIGYATDTRNMPIFSARNPARDRQKKVAGPVILFEFERCEHLPAGIDTIDEIRVATMPIFHGPFSVAHGGPAMSRKSCTTWLMNKFNMIWNSLNRVQPFEKLPRNLPVPVNQVVINASPLILLFNSELSFILPDLFDEIVVPEAVWQEIIASATIDEASRLVSQVDWLLKVTASPAEAVVQWDLGAGETEVLSFALTNPTFKPVLDDRAARKCARSLGLSTLGTGAMLILAKEKKIIDSVEASLTTLRNHGMWISRK